MRVETSPESCLGPGVERSAVAIGKFDAMHLGHQKLISELVSQASTRGLTSVVLTFSNHPNEILSPQRVPERVLGPSQKTKLIANLGVDVLLSLEFTPKLAKLTAEDFVEEYLVDGLAAGLVILGEGQRFGAGGAGTAETLNQLGNLFDFECMSINPVFEAGQPVSTTRVRELLASGHVEDAAKLLGRRHQTSGLVERGRQWGRKLGFPTANLSRDSEGMLPADGIYAGWLWVEGERMPAAHSVGTNDTLGAVPRLVESHVIGRTDLNLYDLQVTVEYVRRIRGWQKFASTDELAQQIRKDVLDCERVLEGEK